MDKKVLVIGAARSGVAVSQLLLNHGKKVILTDNRAEDLVLAEFPQIREQFNALSDDGIEMVFGKQISESIVDELEQIVISPGVPMTIPVIKAALQAGVPVIGEVELAYQMTETPFIAITGTNGKTTTTTLTGEIFSAGGKKTYTVGNIGDPISNYIDIAGPDDIFVTEISAFQLDSILRFRPRGAAILNLSPDHLDRYGEMENYIAAKARIFENQETDDFLVLNADDAQVYALGEKAVCRKVYFSLDKKVAKGAYTMDGTLYVSDGIDEIAVCRVDEIGIKGPHNVQNALAATALAYFSGIGAEAIAAALKSFKGVEHRQEFVATIRGVDYINDSKGTNTNATITALKAMTKPVILIAGGYDKKESYDDLFDVAEGKVKRMIILGETGDDIEACAVKKGFLNTVRVKDYEEAVRVASGCAVPGDVVLLSPACASWDMFDNYEIRGRVFKDLVKRLGASDE